MPPLQRRIQQPTLATEHRYDSDEPEVSKGVGSDSTKLLTARRNMPVRARTNPARRQTHPIRAMCRSNPQVTCATSWQGRFWGNRQSEVFFTWWGTILTVTFTRMSPCLVRLMSGVTDASPAKSHQEQLQDRCTGRSNWSESFLVGVTLNLHN
jgi:hypothetical protein